MKLKKIASLMLAGVMAVSMLAGCSNNGGNNNNNNNEDPVVNTGMAGKVIAALDGDTTKNVAFSASNSLETVLEKAVKDAGVNFDDLTAADLNAIDGDLSTDARLPFVWGTEGNDKKEQSITVVYYLNGFGVDESWAVQKLAEFIDDYGVSYVSEDGVNGTKSAVCADLSMQSKTYTDSEGKEYWYDFTYTGSVAVVETSSAVTGQSTYVAAFTVTRTPAKVMKSSSLA